MRRIFRRLWGGGRPRRVSGGNYFFLDVQCERCGERFHLYVNRATDCLQIFDEAGVAWRLQREVVGSRCRSIMQVRIDLAPGGEIVRREISHGRFLMTAEDSWGI